MTPRGVDFLELWIERNVLPRSADRDQALRLAMKLESDAAAENLTLEDLEIQPGEAEKYIPPRVVLFPFLQEIRVHGRYGPQGGLQD